MEIKELQEQIESKFADLKKQVEEKTAGVKEEQFTEFKDDFDTFKEASIDKETIEEMQKQLDSLDIKLQKKATKTAEKKSFQEALNEELNNVYEGLQGLKKNRAAAVDFEVKATDMTISSDYTGSVAYSDLDTNISDNNCPLVFRNLVNVGTTDGGQVVYIDKVQVDNATAVAEGTAKPQIEFQYEEKTAKVIKIAAYVKMSKEMLDDLAFIRGEINSGLRAELQRELEEQIATGNGTAPNMNGILTQAPAFDVTGTQFATAVDAPNNADVLRVAVALVSSNCCTANAIVLNPQDAAMIDLAKATDGHYILPPFTDANGVRVAGVPILTSSEVAAGNFVVGDFTKANLKIREAANINVGYENDDFTRNMVTILGELRASLYIKSNDLNCFVQGDFATAITAIATV